MASGVRFRPGTRIDSKSNRHILSGDHTSAKHLAKAVGSSDTVSSLALVTSKRSECSLSAARATMSAA